MADDALERVREIRERRGAPEASPAVAKAPLAEPEELRARAELLRPARLFRTLPRRELDRVAAHLAVVEAPARTPVFRMGERADRVFVIRSGHVKVGAIEPRRGRLQRVVRPGGLLGVMDVVEERPRTSDAETLEDSTLLALAAGRFRALIEHHPAMQTDLLGLVAEGLRRTGRVTQELVFLSASGRLARTLVRLAAENGPAVAGRTELGVHLTQRELGQLCRVSRVRVNRILASFQARGWVELGTETLTVLDPSALLRHAAAEEGSSTP